MSEPVTQAQAIEPISTGIWHWTIHDERIDFRSEAYAVATPAGLVLIDPLPIDEAALSALGPIAAICLTGSFHQRSAWRYRRELGLTIHAPRGAAGLLESADFEFRDGQRLFDGLVALERPGPTQPHAVFLTASELATPALFCGDLLMRGDTGPLTFVPDSHQDDPAQSRASARSLLELTFDALCPSHGAPLLSEGRQAIRLALESD